MIFHTIEPLVVWGVDVTSLVGTAVKRAKAMLVSIGRMMGP